MSAQAYSIRRSKGSRLCLEEVLDHAKTSAFSHLSTEKGEIQLHMES